MSDLDRYGPPHVPTPTDICATCGMGLVHISSEVDATTDEPRLRDTRLRRAIRAFQKVWRATTIREATMAGPRYVIPPENAIVIGRAADDLFDALAAAYQDSYGE